MRPDQWLLPGSVVMAPCQLLAGITDVLVSWDAAGYKNFASAKILKPSVSQRNFYTKYVHRDILHPLFCSCLLPFTTTFQTPRAFDEHCSRRPPPPSSRPPPPTSKIKLHSCLSCLSSRCGNCRFSSILSILQALSLWSFSSIFSILQALSLSLSLSLSLWSFSSGRYPKVRSLSLSGRFPRFSLTYRLSLSLSLSPLSLSGRFPRFSLSYKFSLSLSLSLVVLVNFLYPTDYSLSLSLSLSVSFRRFSLSYRLLSLSLVVSLDSLYPTSSLSLSLSLSLWSFPSILSILQVLSLSLSLWSFPSILSILQVLSLSLSLSLSGRFPRFSLSYKFSLRSA